MAAAQLASHQTELAQLREQLRSSQANPAANATPPNSQQQGRRVPNLVVVLGAVAGLAGVVTASHGLFKDVWAAIDKTRTVNDRVVKLEERNKKAESLLGTDIDDWHRLMSYSSAAKASTVKSPIDIDNTYASAMAGRPAYLRYDGRRMAALDAQGKPEAPTTITVQIRGPVRILLRPLP